MPLKYWDEAFLTAAYLINRLPSKVIQSQTPQERLFGHKGDYSMLRIFGCACWPNLRPYNRHKLEFRSKQCAFIGYSNMHKGYKCLDISTGRLYIFYDIVFDESVFPFASLHSNAGARLHDKINLLPLNLQPFNLHGHEGCDLQGLVDANPTDNTVAESFVQNSDQNYISRDDSTDFSATGADPHVDYGGSTSAQSIGTDSGRTSASGSRLPVGRPALGFPAPSVPAITPAVIATHPKPSGIGSQHGPATGGLSPLVASPDGSSVTVAPLFSATHLPTGSFAESAEYSAISSPSTGSAVDTTAVVSSVQERPHTRFQSGVSKPKKFTDGTIRYFHLQVNLLVLLKHLQMFVGRLLWTRSMLLCSTIRLGILFLLIVVKILLTVSGCIKLNGRLMVLLIVTRLVWLLKDSSSVMALTTRTPLVPWLNLLLFVWFSLLLFLVDENCVSLMSKMLSCMEFWKKRYLCVSLLGMKLVWVMFANLIKHCMVSSKHLVLGIIA
jgi:hypothetical protein